jgi:hypothetical protein
MAEVRSAISSTDQSLEPALGRTGCWTTRGEVDDGRFVLLVGAHRRASLGGGAHPAEDSDVIEGLAPDAAEKRLANRIHERRFERRPNNADADERIPKYRR